MLTNGSTRTTPSIAAWWLRSIDLIRKKSRRFPRSFPIAQTNQEVSFGSRKRNSCRRFTATRNCCSQPTVWQGKLINHIIAHSIRSMLRCLPTSRKNDWKNGEMLLNQLPTNEQALEYFGLVGKTADKSTSINSKPPIPNCFVSDEDINLSRKAKARKSQERPSVPRLRGATGSRVASAAKLPADAMTSNSLS